MTLPAIQRSDPPTCWYHCELTMREMLSDSIVRAVMKADGVDPEVLEVQLRSMAQTMPGREPGWLAACSASKAMSHCMLD